jgi:16S rRNA (adenine1518-N6/adenine1519-N6)-dimethyltransferase
MAFAGHRARKRFGQHWLIDPKVLDAIVAAAEIQPQDRVLEVGPGRGALTARLLASPAAEIRAVELDRDLVAGLRDRFGADPRFRLIEGDVLAVPLHGPGDPPATKVVANIPYNITGPLLERLLGRPDAPVTPPFRSLVLLLQQEVARRIGADAGSSCYSSLSVRVQLMARCRAVCPVPPRCFKPPPRVMSEVLVIEPLAPEQWLPAPLAREVDRLLRRCFAARRKMLRNTLAGMVPAPRLEEIAKDAGVDLRQRPQDLPPRRWVALAEALASAAPPPPAAPAPPPPPSPSPPPPPPSVSAPSASLPSPDA